MDRSKAKKIIALIEAQHPLAECELSFGSDFELLVAVILSAQCTDKRVNEVTKKLFATVNTPQGFAAMSIEELAPLIYSCGFYRSKAANIISASKDIVNKYGGRVPDTFEKLIGLAGVGEKTASVVMATAFGGNFLAVDTHVFRVCGRIGLSHGKTPHEVREEVTALLQSGLASAHHALIFHGRYCCKAARPDCAACSVSAYCEYFASGKATQTLKEKRL